MKVVKRIPGNRVDHRERAQMSLERAAEHHAFAIRGDAVSGADDQCASAPFVSMVSANPLTVPAAVA